MHEGAVNQILGRCWERYAQEEIAHAGEDYPGRDRVIELFGEPAPFEEVVAPFGASWPGLAAAPSGPWADAERLAAQVLAGLMEEDGEEEDEEEEEDDDEKDLDGEVVDGGKVVYLLDRACRSTDVPALAEGRGLALSWPYDVPEMCAVLRSWEERFGTRLVGLGRDRVIVSVAAPVRGMSEAEAVAAEHFAFASDTVPQVQDETLRAYAANRILGKQVWSFWWD